MWAKMQFCGRWRPLIAGSNTSEWTDGRLLCLLCVVYVAVCAMDWSLIQGSYAGWVHARVCGCVFVCVCKLQTSKNSFHSLYIFLKIK